MWRLLTRAGDGYAPAPTDLGTWPVRGEDWPPKLLGDYELAPSDRKRDCVVGCREPGE